jgi:hypothetical protein
LDSYSLEEILKYLDGKGYDVDVRLKGITPLDPTSAVGQPQSEPVSDEPVL